MSGPSKFDYINEALAKAPLVPLTEEERRLLAEVEQEDDGRWIADVPTMPGVMAYGQTPQEALDAVSVLASRVAAEHIEPEWSIDAKLATSGHARFPYRGQGTIGEDFEAPRFRFWTALWHWMSR